MRAFTVLLALVATPFLAGVSQQKTNNGLGHDAAHCARRVAQRPGEAINKCDPAPTTPPPVVNPPVVDPPAGDPPPSLPPPPLPPPPAPPPVSGGGCVSSGPAGGTASIDGQVFVDASPWPGLQSWCVTVSGPVNATAVTDASGNYLFPGLPAGTRSEEHTSELQSRLHLVCRLLLEKKKTNRHPTTANGARLRSP